MMHNRERLALTIMLAAFLVCCALAAGVPYNVWAYVNGATDVPLSVVVSNQGTVQIARGEGSPPIAVNPGDSVTLANDGNRVSTDANAQAGVDIVTLDGLPLAGLTVYAKTAITLTHLSAPRFTWGPQPPDYEVTLALKRGRTRVQVPADRSPQVHLYVDTPFGRVTLDGAGAYSIEVDDREAQVSHVEGLVSLNCGGSHSTIPPEQAGKMDDEQCARVDRPERNVVDNGDFHQALSGTWGLIGRTDTGYPTGTVERILDEGQGAVRFFRAANAWGQTGIQQTLDYPIKDKSAVILHLQVRIDYQKLDACGSKGTECPIMVRVNFQDKSGLSRRWIQGFYAEHDPALPTSQIPLGCPADCEEVHLQEWLRVTPRKWAPTWDSPNLLVEMQNQGFNPVTITSIEVYAVGHSYTSLVRDIQLLVRD